MTIEVLKSNLESNTLDEFYIFLNSENSFLSNQYIKAISETKQLKIVYVDDLKSLLPDKNDIFGSTELIDSTCLYVYKVNIFDSKDFGISDIKNLIIVCDKIDEETKQIYSSYVVEMPKLLDWQIKDYVYTLGDGIDTKKLDWLINVSNSDIYRLHNELSKLNMFSVKERDSLFDLMSNEDAFIDLSNYVIFDLTNAILQKDIKRIMYMLEDVKNWDCEPLGLQVLLTNNFKKVLSIQLSPNATAEKLNMNPKQFYAVKKNTCGYYSRDQLIKIFDIVSSCDYKMKSGELSNDMLIDYMILHILSA